MKQGESQACPSWGSAQSSSASQLHSLPGSFSAVFQKVHCKPIYAMMFRAKEN